ncbi:hypothetical protein AFCA_006295 [Aspergillus flavus]|nr:hypothetical protein AFCA_006295 [Aspergillus flavus]
MRVNNSARRPRNPLLLRTPEELEDDVHKFYDRNNLKDVVDLELLVKGARIAQEPDNLYTLSLTPAEFKAIKDEKESGFWQQKAGSSPRLMRVQKAGSMTCHPKEKTGRSPIYYWVALLMLRLGYREVLLEPG